jgi:hypothetical protein
MAGTLALRPAAGARALGFAGLSAALLSAAPAWGETPACQAAIAGQLSVQADVQCECRWFTESRLADTPAGYRWDCGILRPRLNYAVPVDLNPYPYALPEGLSLELPTGQEPRSDPPRHR